VPPLISKAVESKNTMSKRGSTKTMLIREESAISLAQDDGGLMNAPNMKELQRFEVSVENVPPGVILKEFERTVKLNKATNP